jgi:UDP-GlcNAc:undecaprenyl-phosphate/decaprenyl-phosphate GlcNAc-1-phosphate transferase
MPSSFSLIDFVSIQHYLISPLIAFSAVLVTTPLVKEISLKCGQLDHPSHRKVHHSPIARTGGIAICLSMVLSLLFIWVMGGLEHLLPATQFSLKLMLGGGIGFFCIGLADDLIDLSPLLRLGMQCAVACALWTQGLRIECVTFPTMWNQIDTVSLGVLSLPITVLWLTGVVNAINWIDGLDGLATGVGGIVVAISLIVCLQAGQFGAALVGVTLLGSLAGFLVFNFNPAQIFMGDGGSYFVGFLLAAMSISGQAEDVATTAILLPLLILAVPVVDMTLVILARLRQGKSPFLSDNRHLHHRLLKAGLSHRFTVLFIYALTYWTGSLALVCIDVPGSALMMGSATGILIIISCKAWLVSQQQALSS